MRIDHTNKLSTASQPLAVLWQVIARTTIDVPRTLGALMATGRHNRGLKARCPGLWARCPGSGRVPLPMAVSAHSEVPDGAWVVYTDGGYDPPEEEEPEKCGWGI